MNRERERNRETENERKIVSFIIRQWQKYLTWRTKKKEEKAEGKKVKAKC